MVKKCRSFRRAITVLIAVLLGTAVSVAQQPPSASAILDKAKGQTAEGNRAIFAIFHASW